MRTRTRSPAALVAAASFVAAYVTASLFFQPLWAHETSSTQLAQKVSSMVDQDEKRLIEIFQQLHANPELGFQEVQTAALVAKEFRDLGYETHTGIGKTGVVGILKNGPGPVIMFRSDMDALPVLEETGLPYASRATGTSARWSLT